MCEQADERLKNVAGGTAQNSAGMYILHVF